MSKARAGNTLGVPINGQVRRPAISEAHRRQQAAGGADVFHTKQVLFCGNKLYINIVCVLAKTEQHMHT